MTKKNGDPHPAGGLSKNKYDAKGKLRPARKTRSRLDPENKGETIKGTQRKRALRIDTGIGSLSKSWRPFGGRNDEEDAQDDKRGDRAFLAEAIARREVEENFLKGKESITMGGVKVIGDGPIHLAGSRTDDFAIEDIGFGLQSYRRDGRRETGVVPKMADFFSFIGGSGIADKVRETEHLTLDISDVLPQQGDDDEHERNEMLHNFSTKASGATGKRIAEAQEPTQSAFDIARDEYNMKYQKWIESKPIERTEIYTGHLDYEGEGTKDRVMEELYGEGTPEHYSGRGGRYAYHVYRDEDTGKYHRRQIEGIREHERAEPERPNYRDYRSPTPPTPEPTEAEILTKSYADSGKSAIAEKVAEIHPDLGNRDLYPQLPYEQYDTGPKRRDTYRSYNDKNPDIDYSKFVPKGLYNFKPIRTQGGYEQPDIDQTLPANHLVFKEKQDLKHRYEALQEEAFQRQYYPEKFANEGGSVSEATAEEEGEVEEAPKPKEPKKVIYRMGYLKGYALKGGAKANRFSSHKEAKAKYLSLPASRQKDVGGITKTKLGYELRRGSSITQAQDPKNTEKSFVLD